MTEDRRDDQHEPQQPPTGQHVRRSWKRPSLTAYGPIGKLTQGGTGAKTDGSTSRKAAGCL